MSNDMESMRTFADQLWKYMVPKLDSKFASNVSYFRAQVVLNLGNNTLEVQRPVENGTLTLPCVRAMSGAQAGQQVVALVMGSMSNAIVVGDGNLNVPGGTGDAGIANFQAQPDGSLVITLINGNTLTATPHDPTKQDVLTFDDVPTQGSNNPVKSGGVYTALDNKVDKVTGKGLSTNDFTNSLKDKLDGIEAGAEVNQNAFSNVAVGSVTVSADAKQDTLTLNAGGLVTLTGDATNDSVTIYVDPNHTHITTQVLDLVNADSYGPSGMVSFDADVAEVPLKNCVVDIEPTQAGSGTPSPTNVRAISGWTGANVTRAGKNLLKMTGISRTESGVTFVLDSDSGKVTASGTSTALIYFFLGSFTLYPGTYTLSGNPGGLSNCVLYDNTWTFSDSGNGSTATITETKTLNFFIRCEAGVNFSTETVFLPMLRLAAGTDAAFEPFKGEVFDVSFPSEAGTVYGGTLDVLKGTLTVDAVVKQLQNLAIGYSGQYFYSTISNKLPGNTNIISDIYRTVDVNVEDMPQASIKGNNLNKNIYIKDSRYSSVSALLAAEGGRTIVYKTATPVTYQLSPRIISTLLGSNSIWADCGTISVDYGAFLSALDKAIEEHSDDDIRHTTEAEKTKLGGIEAGAQVNQNAFSNIKVGSTTVAADSKTDTLELVAGTNMTITPDATNDKITFAATLGSHTHDASDITTGILSAARGGTGNGNGYIQIGKKNGTTLGSYATAEGNGTTASGSHSHAEGSNTTASGSHSHAEGSNTTASGSHSHAEGSNTTASENRAHAEGYYAIASGEISHAEGHSTKASGPRSHAEGRITEASGECAHAEGYNTKASGDYSHAEGLGTIASGVWQHVFGKYNVEDQASSEVPGSGAYFEIVGKGSSASNRSNARTLDYTGNEWIAGTLTQASDARLKDVQGEIPDLSSIRAVRFRWKNGDDKEHLGYLAQDVEEIAPYLVDVDSNGYKSLDYIALLTAKVEMLEREIEKLKGDTRN